VGSALGRSKPRFSASSWRSWRCHLEGVATRPCSKRSFASLASPSPPSFAPPSKPRAKHRPLALATLPLDVVSPPDPPAFPSSRAHTELEFPRDLASARARALAQPLGTPSNRDSCPPPAAAASARPSRPAQRAGGSVLGRGELARRRAKRSENVHRARPQQSRPLLLREVCNSFDCLCALQLGTEGSASGVRASSRPTARSKRPRPAAPLSLVNPFLLVRLDLQLNLASSSSLAPARPTAPARNACAWTDRGSSQVLELAGEQSVGARRSDTLSSSARTISGERASREHAHPRQNVRPRERREGRLGERTGEARAELPA